MTTLVGKGRPTILRPDCRTLCATRLRHHEFRLLLNGSHGLDVADDLGLACCSVEMMPPGIAPTSRYGVVFRRAAPGDV